MKVLMIDALLIDVLLQIVISDWSCGTAPIVLFYNFWKLKSTALFLILLLFYWLMLSWYFVLIIVVCYWWYKYASASLEIEMVFTQL